VRTIEENDNGEIWIGTGGGGINVYSTEKNSIQYLLPSLSNTYAISSNIIYDIYKDDLNDLWIGTYNGGVSRTNKLKGQFNHIKGFGGKNELNNNVILSVCELPNGEVWLGTDGGGVNILKKDNSIETKKLPLKSSNVVITALAYHSLGFVIVGTYRDGLLIYNTKSRTFRHFKAGVSNNSISSNDIWDVKVDKDGFVWLATLGGGLVKIDLQTNKIRNYRANPGTPNKLQDANLSCLLVDSDNNLWVGSYHYGLSLLSDPKNDIFKQYSFGEDDKYSIGSSEVLTLYEDSEKNIWIGTQDGGLSKLNKQNQTITRYTTEHGLPTNNIRGILQDNDGNYWVSTIKGISVLKFTKDSLTSIKNFSSKDGLQHNEFNNNACLKRNNGSLLFGGINGINLFDPIQIATNSYNANIVIREISVNDTIQHWSKKNSVISSDINYAEQIDLNYNQRNIELELALLDYTEPSKNAFYYRLIGYNNYWTESRTGNRIKFTNLDPGSYTLEIKASNNHGHQSEKVKSIIIKIAPPFWEKWWFRLLLVAFIVAAVLIAYRLRVRALRIQKVVLKQKVEESTHELKQMNAQLSDQNKRIEDQKKELLQQTSNLERANKKLEDSQLRVRLQNLELEKHQNHLEDIVQKRTEQLEKSKLKAEESERLKMAFLSNMSHEIRTPMNAIIGFTTLLGDEDNNEKDIADYIHHIQTNSESLLVLINDILDLSKIEANQLVVRKEPFDISSFMNDIYLNWKYTADENTEGVKLHFENQNMEEGIICNSDVFRLRQIMNNLIDNAFKFTSKGSVTIGYKVIDDSVEFFVRDTGIGIPEEHMAVIFNRFNKLEDSKRKVYRGAGLGLTISKKLAELLQGDLLVSSENKKGSEFTLVVPLNEIKNESIKKERNVRTFISKKRLEKSKFVDLNLKGKKIMVVEDEVTNYKYLEGVLLRHNATVLWAKNGEEAVSQMARQKLDLILMDIKMPKMNGLDATRKIKSAFPKQVVIAQTAFARPDEEEQYRQVGFDDFIAKPIKRDDLLSMLSKYLS
jgi:signal transduction histidine kinase/CheY-like chemotaxis protein